MQTIDLRQLIAAKSPRLLRWSPGFVLRYLERILHLKEVNHVLTTFTRPGLPFLRDLLDYMHVTYTIRGAEKLRLGQRYIFVSNHSLNGLDGVIILDAISKTFPQVKFLVNDVLLYIEPLRPMFLPVNKFGSQSADGVRQLREAFESDDQLFYFPAGIGSRRSKGKIMDLPWKKNFVKMATEYQRNVVPIFFDGRNSNFFYRLANFRKFIGIKANIEMLYLVDELFRLRNRHFNLTVGDEIPYTTFTHERRPAEWAAYVREKVYEMQGEIK
jgi:putative hemolysin